MVFPNPFRPVLYASQEEGERRYREQQEPKRRSAGFTDKSRSPEELRALCHETAADLGLVPVGEDPSGLRWRDPFMLRMFSVEVVGGIRGEYGDVGVTVTGSSGGGGSIAQPRYLDRLVRAFADRVERGDRAQEVAFETPERKRRRRMMLGYLRLTQWVPLVLLLPLIILTQVYWEGLKPVALIVAWCYLVVAVPLAANFFRRRVAGVGSPGDLMPFAVATGTFVAGVAVWLVLV